MIIDGTSDSFFVKISRYIAEKMKKFDFLDDHIVGSIGLFVIIQRSFYTLYSDLCSNTRLGG
jgi:hypothetical protein